MKEPWQGDTRLVEQGWIEEDSFTPSPAYSTADVLAVRGHELLARAGV